MNFPLFIIPIAAGLVAQFMKPIVNKKLYGELSEAGRKMPRYGGMPSAHTSFAVSLMATVGMVAGFSSVSFVMAAAILIFILDDALRMRIYLGRYGLALSRLMKKLPEEEKKDIPYIEKRLGHTPLEALAGAIVGLVVTFAILAVI